MPIRGRFVLSKRGRTYKECALYRTRMRFFDYVELHINVVLPDRVKRDLDNLLKAPLDALVYAGILGDDSLVKRIVIEQVGICNPGWLDVLIMPWVRDTPLFPRPEDLA